jgi:hypothetical protein
MFAAAVAAVTATACTGMLGGHAIPFSSNLQGTAVVEKASGGTSVLKALHKQVVIGSTIDPVNGDQNPYGLVVGTANGGKVKKGNLYVCNFNDKANVQGTGTTIVSLAPTPGSMPAHFAESSSILGS